LSKHLTGPIGDYDASFFEAVYRKTYRSTLTYALRRTKDEADAYDVVAETYTVAWRRIRELRNVELPQAWIYGIAHKVLSNHRRSRARREALSGRVRHAMLSEAHEDPERSVEKRLELAEVCAALAQLPQRDQEALRLAAFEGLDAREIAVVLSVPAPLVRSILYRARRRLNAALLSRARQDGGAGHGHDDGEQENASRRRYHSG